MLKIQERIKNQNGGMLIEIMLAGIILMGASYAVIKWNASIVDSEYAVRVGTHMKTLSYSVSRFAVEQKSILVDHLRTGEVCDAVHGFYGAQRMPVWKLAIPRIGSLADPVQPGTVGRDPACAAVTSPVVANSVADGVAEIDLQILKNSGYLPASFPEVDENGSSYKILLRRTGVQKAYDLDGLVISSDAIRELTDGGNISWEGIGEALNAAGANAGVVRISDAADVAHGFTSTGMIALFSSSSYNGSRPLWWADLSTYGFSAPFIATEFNEGALVSRISTKESELRSDLSSTTGNAMGGNLKMNEFGIKNAETIQVIGQQAHGNTCTLDQEGQITRMAGEATTSSDVTRLVECENGLWKNITGLRGAMTFDFAAVFNGAASIPSGSLVVPPGITKIRVKIEAGGGGGGCGMATYPVAPPAGFMGGGVTYYARNFEPAEVYYESFVTGSRDTLSGSCLWPYYGGGGCSVTMTNSDHYTSLLQQKSMPGPSFVGGGGGGGAGGRGIFLLNVQPGDEVRAFAGPGGQGCSAHPMSEPRTSAGVIIRDNQISTYVDAIDNSKEGSPSAILIFRDGNPLFSISVLGGEAGRNGATPWCGRFDPSTNTYSLECGWFAGEGGRSGEGYFVAYHYPSATMVTPYAGGWDPIWGAVVDTSSENTSGEPGTIIQGNWVRGLYGDSETRLNCYGGRGGGAAGGNGGDAYQNGSIAGEYSFAFAAGGGGGGCVFNPIGAFTTGGNGAQGVVTVEW